MLLRCSVKGRAVPGWCTHGCRAVMPGLKRGFVILDGQARATRGVKIRCSHLRRAVCARKTRILPCAAPKADKGGHSSGQCGEIGAWVRFAAVIAVMPLPSPLDRRPTRPDNYAPSAIGASSRQPNSRAKSTETRAWTAPCLSKKRCFPFSVNTPSCQMPG